MSDSDKPLDVLIGMILGASYVLIPLWLLGWL